jgi:uncharacterized protein YndB with AHSA1/START domain
MSGSTAVTVTRRFEASPERVFSAFENPAELARWMGQRGSKTEVLALDVREGGDIRVQMSWDKGMVIRLAGTFERVERPSLLAFSWAMEGDDANAGVVSVEFDPDGSGTALTVTHEGLTGPALAQARAGWNGWLDGLRTLVEAN